MALDASFAGRSFPAAESYLVGREKIREFATAIGDDNPICHDRAAAAAAGHPDLIAPPTFAIAVIARAQDAVYFHPDLGLDFSRVVHRDQKFTQHQPIRAGNELFNHVTVDGIRQLAGNDVITVRTEITDGAGAAVCSAVSTLVARA